MVGRNGAFGILIGAAVGTLFLVPAHGLAQDPPRASCVGVDYLSPLEDLIRCAARGSAYLQFQLGVRYDDGRMNLEDDAEAVRWYRKAADRGHGIAQISLGVMYENGEGVPEDLVFAYMWFNLSAAQGQELAQRNKEGIERRMTREQIAEAQRLSREWLERHR